MLYLYSVCFLPGRSSVFLSVRPSVCHQSCQHHILKTNKPVLLQIGTSDQRERQSTLNFVCQHNNIMLHYYTCAVIQSLRKTTITEQQAATQDNTVSCNRTRTSGTQAFSTTKHNTHSMGVIGSYYKGRISLQTMCWEIGDKRRSWNKSQFTTMPCNLIQSNRNNRHTHIFNTGLT